MSGENAIRASIGEFVGRPLSSDDDDAGIMELVADSFTLVELIIALQQRHRCTVTADDLRDVATVGDLIALFGARAA